MRCAREKLLGPKASIRPLPLIVVEVCVGILFAWTNLIGGELQ